MRRNKVGEPKLFKLFGRFSIVLLFATVVLSAESFEDFKRSQAESFQKYKDERDNAFNKYLKEQWKGYNAFKGTPLYEKPKPKSIQSAKPTKIKDVGPTVKIRLEPLEKKEMPKKTKPKEVKKKTEPQGQEKSVPKVSVEKPVEPKVVQKQSITPKKMEVPVVVTKKPIKKAKKKDIDFDFFGTELGFDTPENIKAAHFYPQSQKGIAAFFDVAASSEYESLVSEVKQTAQKMNLNDWGIYLLVNKIAQKIFSDPDDAKLLSWFLFNKLGYAVKVGIANKHVVLMHYSKKIIYSTPNYRFGNEKFYVVANYAKGRVGRLYTYSQNYPGSDKPLDLSLKSLPKFAENIKSKTLSYKKYGNSIEIPITYNQNLIDFMATYPQADYATFFNAPVDEETYRSVAEGLKKYIDGKKASTAMNFVLNFVQNAFAYQRDDQQFGREKVMFAEETLYYDKSDCEDRATLFSYLIKELFGIGVIGVKYKDHMSTALYIPMNGDTVTANAKRFVLADPTYINASIGQEMPQYKSQIPDSYIVVHPK